MENFTIAEIVGMAVEAERLGYEFYTGMAEKFKKSKEFGRLFETLAGMEKAHERRFGELVALVGGREPEDWQEAQKYFGAIVESAFFLGKGKSLPKMAGIKTAKDAIELALGFERETLLFYLGLRAEVREKDMIDEIIAEEKSHIVRLHSLGGSLRSSGPRIAPSGE